MESVGGKPQLPVEEGRSIFKDVLFTGSGLQGARRQAHKAHRGAAAGLVTCTFDPRRWPQDHALSRGLCL